MAYTCILRGEVLEVHETLHGWQSTQHYYWYYNVVTWMRSLSGREGARPDYPMQQSEIRWVQQHYLPKAIDLTNSPTGRAGASTPQVQNIPIHTQEVRRLKDAFRRKL